MELIFHTLIDIHCCFFSCVLDVLKVKDTMLESKASNAADCTEHGGHIQQWNPMEADFLAPKNNYAYDDEDASIAIQGYSK